MKSEKLGLTTRQKEIIYILTNFDTPITVLLISKKMSLSERTILRDIKVIDEWFIQNNFKLIIKPRVGIIIDEDLYIKNLILSLLNIEITKSFSRYERARLILLELLSRQIPLKSFYFQKEFNISEGTLNSDFNYLYEYINSYNIRIVKRQGVGIYIAGDELDFRELIASILFDLVGQNQIIKLLKDTEKNINNTKNIKEKKLLDIIDKNKLPFVEKAIYNVFNNLSLKYIDSEYINLVVNICICISRINKKCYIKFDEEKLYSILSMRESDIARNIAKNLYNMLNINFNEDEIAFITMHISSTRILQENNVRGINIKQITLRKTVVKMIDVVESELNVSLRENSLLIEDLMRHIEIVISRLTMKIKIKSLSYDNIKNDYEEVFNATKKACNILKTMYNIDYIPKEEIALIAVYFCVGVYEKQKIYAILVCINGIGTSKMLSSSLKQQFNEIEIIDTVSAIDINIEKTFKNDIDIIISTTHIEDDNYTDNIICVNPILLDEDKIAIRKILNKIKNKKIFKNKKNSKQEMTKEDIKYSIELGDKILQTIDNVKLKIKQNINDINNLFEIASKMFLDNYELQKKVSNMIKLREEKSSTYISELNILLLHTKTHCVAKCYLGYIRLQEIFYDKNMKIEGAIVMIIPDDDLCVKIMGEISSYVIENKKMLYSLKYGDIDNIKLNVENSLVRLFKNSIIN